MKNLLKIFLSIISVVYVVLSLCGAVQGETSDDVLWQNLETKYTIILYQSLEDLKKFDKKIDYSPDEWGISRLFSGSGADKRMDKLKKKIDALHERVQWILGMRKKKNKLKINIYPDKEKLHATFSKIYKKSYRSYKTSLRIRAWYIFESNTIYITVDDLNEGILAHEIAHSVIDQYLKVRPPKAAAEILARYVDKHLFK